MNTMQRPAELPAFDCKGSVLTVTVLHVRETDPDLLYPQLEQKIGQARAFFANAPMLVDLRNVDGPCPSCTRMPVGPASAFSLCPGWSGPSPPRRRKNRSVNRPHR